jgi:thymidylate synthase (FAD)|tara:strand:+ start:513 stop:1181 length:669 start_codon:yes stop_codon:yes gene_type:complete
MIAKLVSYSQPVKENVYTDWDAKDLIGYAARVSNPSNQMNKETVEKLLNYLIKYKHWSPFEMVSACIEIETTRDIARQILRHRSFSFQEFSQRYANPVEELEFITREARVQDEKNRQNSIEVDDRTFQIDWEREQKRVIWMCEKVYKAAIKKGIAKEVARAVLPEGLIKSRLYVNGTIRSWIHFIELRSANGTQKECMEVARACGEAISKIFPMIKEFYDEQ